MEQKIKITDERIDQQIPVAMENVKAEVLEAKPQTFQTLDEKGEIVETTINIVQPTQTVTLKDLNAEIGDMESRLEQAKNQVVELTTEIERKRAFMGQLEAIVRPVYEDLQVALQAKEPVGLTPATAETVISP